MDSTTIDLSDLQNARQIRAASSGLAKRPTTLDPAADRRLTMGIASDDTSLTPHATADLGRFKDFGTLENAGRKKNPKPSAPYKPALTVL